MTFSSQESVLLIWPAGLDGPFQYTGRISGRTRTLEPYGAANINALVNRRGQVQAVAGKVLQADLTYPDQYFLFATTSYVPGKNWWRPPVLPKVRPLAQNVSAPADDKALNDSRGSIDSFQKRGVAHLESGGVSGRETLRATRPSN